RRQIKEGRASRKQPPGGHPVARAAKERSRWCTYSRNSDQTEIGDALLEDETAREREKKKTRKTKCRLKKKKKEKRGKDSLRTRARTSNLPTARSRENTRKS
ncbi:unnamed protein product, partial [Ixodes pacificus]